ncbi:hypothetical protein ACX0G9_21780 [Flavitalea flava]
MNKTIGKASAFATAFISAIVSEHYSTVLGQSGGEIAHLAGPVMLVLSHLLTHIGSEFVAPVAEEVMEQFERKNPNELNHDLQKTLLESMQKAIEGIELLYKEKYPDNPLNKPIKKFLRSLRKDFFTEFSSAEGFTLENNDFKKIMYTSDEKKDNRFLYTDKESPVENDFSKALNQRLAEELAGQDLAPEFQELFIKNFLPLTQLYFGEKLKQDKGSAARRAMERMLSEETLIGINKLIAMQETAATVRKEDATNAGSNTGYQRKGGKFLKMSPQQMEELKSLVRELKDNNQLDVQFGEALDNRFEQLASQYKALHGEVLHIKKEVHAIRHTLSINMRYALIVAGISLVVATILIVRKINTPFTASVTLVNDPGLPLPKDYPGLKFPVKGLLLLPDRTETIVFNEDRSAVSPPLDHDWLHKKMAFRLEDEYWSVSSDSLILSDERTRVSIRPTDKLAHVEGTVAAYSGKSGSPNLSNQTNQPNQPNQPNQSNKPNQPGSIFIKGAEVHLGGDTVLYTNDQGVFKALLPSTMLRPMHKVTVIAPGYREETEDYYPNSTPLRFMLQPQKPLR